MTELSESIYKLVPEVHIPPAKPPMYHSKFDPKKTPITGSTFCCFGSTLPLGGGHVVKKQCATLGSPHKEAADPKHFLKRGEKKQPVAPRPNGPQDFKYNDQRKAGVPRKDEKPVMGLKSNKNFITANAVEAILAVPRGIDTSKPDYLTKADYGKVPQYLSQVKEEIRRENELIDEYVKEQMGLNAPQEKLEELNDQERRDLIDALKTKWDAINKRYQATTHMVKIETYGMLKRKENLERELKQLEADIELLERHGPLLVRAG